MSAKKNEVRLYARPYDPATFNREEAEKPAPWRHRLADVVQAEYRGAKPFGDDVRMGRRGYVVSDLTFEGLTRDLGTGTGASGGFLAKTSQPQTVIEAMQSALVCKRAGARFERPEGDWSPLPRVASVGAAQWVNVDGGAVGETSVAFGQIAVAPKLASASVDISRMLNLLTGKLAERTVTRELIRMLAGAVDLAALIGKGTDGEPHGIAITPGVGSVSGTTLGWSGITEMLRLVEVGNGTPTGWMLSPATAKVLRGRQRFTGTDSPILDDENRIAGIPAFVTSGMDDTLVCGDFTRLAILGENVEMIVDPFTQSKNHTVQVVLLQYGDVAVEHPAAFCIAPSVT